MNEKDFLEFVKEIQEQERIFWEEEYPSYDLSQKKSYWLANIHRGMRTQGEAIGDEYSLFSKKSYEIWKETEPDFDQIFAEISGGIPHFDWQEYQRRIQQ